MKITKTNLPDVIIIEPELFTDNRGFFMETWNKREFCNLGLNLNFVQDNHSKSIKNTLRGLHYQIENPQDKLVRITHGKVFEVAVDLRKTSKFFGKWFGIIMSSEEQKMLFIPKGFAHGFYVLSDFAECQYKCTDYYNPASERRVLWSDKTIGINWPINDKTFPILSPKDRNASGFIESQVFE